MPQCGAYLGETIFVSCYAYFSFHTGTKVFVSSGLGAGRNSRQLTLQNIEQTLQ